MLSVIKSKLLNKKHIHTNSLSKLEVDNITPNQVHDILKRNMLVDGYDLVFDTDKSIGPYIHDSKTNKKYLDMFSFFASSPISFNHPKLNNEKFKKEIGEIAIHNPANPDIYTKEMAQFVATFERVCMPENFKHLFLISTGTLAVENALKVAFDWKTRKNGNINSNIIVAKDVIHFKEAFHGRSGYALSLTNTDPTKYKYFPLFNWPRIPNPKIKFPMEGGNLCDVIEAENLALGNINNILEKCSKTIASIIMEPIQGEGGDNHFRPEFWQSLREMANKYEVLLIADEVQSGMGLTGKLWAHEHLGASPDIICFGKKAQVCGIICNDRIDDVDNVFKVPSRINSTWGGNLVDMVRSKKMIEIIEEDNLILNADIVGTYLLSGLYELQNTYPEKISNVRGKGLMCAFDLQNKHLCDKLIGMAYDNQLLIISCGTNSIRLRPVLDITTKDIDKLIEILYICVAKL
jgi:L-lysine 6-transaminase